MQRSRTTILLKCFFFVVYEALYFLLEYLQTVFDINRVLLFINCEKEN